MEFDLKYGRLKFIIKKKMKKNYKIFLYTSSITIIITIYLILNINNKKNTEKYEIPEDQIISINMAEVPQIPWGDDNSVAVHVSETFSSAVHGNFATISSFGNEDTSNQSSLLENYFCDSTICYASLKKGIKFHNNREVTAYDVEFSFLRQPLIKNFDFASSILNDLVGIENAKKEKINYITVNSLKYPSGLIEGIKVKDNYNIIFHLKRENKFFFQKASEGRIPIVPIEEFDDKYLKWKLYPVGFGKYKVINADYKKYKFLLEKVSQAENIPKYFKLIFSSNDVGDIKMALHGPNKGNSIYDRKIVFPNIDSNGGFLFNYQTELGRNANFRKAISLTLNRKKISSLSIHGEMIPEDQMLPNSSWHKEYRANIPIQIQNVAEAKKLLNKVPHRLWKNKILKIPTYWESVKDINSLPYIIEVKNELKEVGLNVEFLDTDMSYTEFRENDENVLWWTGFAFASDDPNRNFAFFHKSPIYIREYPNDPKLDALFEASTQNLSKGSIDTQKLSEYFTKNNIMVIVANTRMIVSYDTRKIASIGAQQNGIRLLLWEIKMVN